DGWLPVGLPLDAIDTMWASVLTTANRYGRDTDAMQLVLRVDPKFTDIALGADRYPFAGTRRQVMDDLERARQIGVTEVILDLVSTTRSVEELVDTALELSAGQLATA
ncbi:MAG: putative hydride transferase, partial [Acidimicrobiia bacterium]|nr:putative hydride transferase [Acidimicrobiia bacterium]